LPVFLVSFTKDQTDSKYLELLEVYKNISISRGGQTFWPKGRICNCLATGGPNAKRFTWQAAANAVLLLSTVGNVVLEKNVQGIWRAGLNWLWDRMGPEGRSLATPSLRHKSLEILWSCICREQEDTWNLRDRQWASSEDSITDS